MNNNLGVVEDKIKRKRNMKKPIKWLFTKNKSNQQEIIKIEKLFNIKFPKDYIDCAVQNHSGAPSPDVYDFKNHKEAVFEWLLSLDTESTSYIVNDYNMIKDRLAVNIYPFASDPFGNYICFDYRVGKDKPPKIVFWDHEIASGDPEKAISYICDSFTELLEKLYDPEEE
jgi:hypothetical protein